MLFYESFFPVLWIVFVLYWQIKAADTKATQRLEPAASRILREGEEQFEQKARVSLRIPKHHYVLTRSR